jgi:hypothetical protein
MPDLVRIKRNVAKMVNMGAPENDIDAYIQAEGVTVEDVRNFKLPPSESIGRMLLRNLQEAGRETYSEAIAPVVHGASTFALGIPEAVAKKTGTKELIYPEQKSLVGKGLRLGSEIAGFTVGGAIKGGRWLLAGAKKAVPKLAGKGVVKSAIRGGIVGAGAGLLQTPTEGEGILKPAERLGQAAMWGAGGAIIPPTIKVGKFIAGVITKSGRWIARNIGGVTDATVNVIKRLGADRVFDPAKAKADYIGRVIVPKAQRRITNALTNFTTKSKHVLKALGMKPEEIETLSKVDKKTLRQLKTLFGDDWNSIQKGLQQIKNNADLRFRATLEKYPNKNIDIKDSYYRLKNLLVKQGWIDLQGNERMGAGISNKTKTNLIKIFQDLKRSLVVEGKTRVTGKISVNEYFNKLNELEASLGEQPKFDRLIYQIQRSLRNDAAKNIPGLSKANKMYSDAAKLLELENAFTKLDNALKLESQLLQLKNISKSQLHQKYKMVLGQDLYDDLLAHLANRDFELVSDIPGTGGGFYPSRSGFIRSAVGKVAKQYYKETAPKIEKLGQRFKRLEDLAMSVIE